MDTDVIYAVRCTTSVLIFPILVHLSSYQETVLIDICKCKASSSTLISHTISIKIIVLKIINLKSSLYLVYVEFFTLTGIKISHSHRAFRDLDSAF